MLKTTSVTQPILSPTNVGRPGADDEGVGFGGESIKKLAKSKSTEPSPGAGFLTPHAGCTENGTPKMSLFFTHHNIIKKNSYQFRNFGWSVSTSSLILDLILAYLNESKGSKFELK